MLTAISPIDGRYAAKTKPLSAYFSEYALIKYRVFVEIEYFIALIHEELPQLKGIPEDLIKSIRQISLDFSEQDAEHIKNIESITNHDVKAVEYFIKEKFEGLGLSQYVEFIHFGLTSQDINNTAIPLSLKDSLHEVILPTIESVKDHIKEHAIQYEGIPMLARTHGQPASPTTLGKEFLVFVERLEIQLSKLSTFQFGAKFGGATGNFNAHKVCFPHIHWPDFGNRFVAGIGLSRHQYTTQIAHYDDLAEYFQVLSRINTIFIDLCRDIWTYISMDYFKQKVVANEVGSSAMPHKVNPIDFENAEGNLGIANAIFGHLAEKLPISRLQRDLTDSTVLRNVGVPLAHNLIAYQSILKGLSKILLHQQKLEEDLNEAWAVVAEAIQNILRREGYPKPYEALKGLTRTNKTITKEILHQFIDELAVTEVVKEEMKSVSPFTYTGYFSP